MEEIKYLFSLSRRLGVNIVDGPVTFLLSEGTDLIQILPSLAQASYKATLNISLPLPLTPPTL